MAKVNIKSEKITPSEHKFLLVFHKGCVIRVHQLIAYV